MDSFTKPSDICDIKSSLSPNSYLCTHFATIQILGILMAEKYVCLLAIGYVFLKDVAMILEYLNVQM